jgi:hypothetical protein
MPDSGQTDRPQADRRSGAAPAGDDDPPTEDEAGPRGNPALDEEALRNRQQERDPAPDEKRAATDRSRS